MSINKILKKCPFCDYPHSDIIGAVVVVEKGKRVSYNLYKCLSKAHPFRVKRKGDKKEQQLTEKFIKSNFIVLKK